jgi:hypothetical protein
LVKKLEEVSSNPKALENPLLKIIPPMALNQLQTITFRVPSNPNPSTTV